VADTGLYAAGANPLRYSDLTGVARARRTAPHDGMRGLAGHGTRVAALTMGGPELLDLLYALDYQPSLRPINIFGRTVEVLYDKDRKPILNGGIPQEVEKFYLDQAELFNALEKESGTVVNLSLGRAKRIEQLERLLNPSNPTLYVVAAGNATQNLEQEDIFPTKYGGSGNPGQYNLITVAALDGSGRIAGFSNHGPKHVDIAADGCDVGTFAFDAGSSAYQRARVSGTSFAAPQVAMAVALVRGTTADIGVVPASMVRMQVLVSSDRHPDEEIARRSRTAAS
jgi:subtilisin family serine protease